MADEQTEGTAENTDQSGNQAGTEQANEINDRIKELETQLAKHSELENQVKTLTEENKRALAEAMRWQSGYKGLQASTTTKLQEAAAMQRQLQEAQNTSSQLESLRETVNLVARRMLDEDQAKEFDLQQRELRLRQAEQAAQTRVQQPQQQYVQDYVDPDIQKKQYLDYYFPGVEIDPSDPQIDWGEGAPSTAEAMRRFTTSVMKVAGKPKQPAQEEPVKSDAQKLLEQIQAQAAQLENAKQLAIEEATAAARREVEERARRLGIDAGTPGTPASDATRKVRSQLDELDESLLSIGEKDSPARKKGVQEYNAKLAAIRQQLIKQ